MDPLAGNQRAYRLADYNARSISPGFGAAGWICRRAAARANRSAVPGCRGRAWGEIFGPEAADTEGIRAAGFTNRDRKSTRLNSSHGYISYAVFCLKKRNRQLAVSVCSSC